MHRFLALSLFFLFLCPLYAQLQKGTWMVGGDIGISSQQYDRDVNVFALDIQPAVAFMVHDRIMVGASTSIGLQVREDFREGVTRQSVFVRHFFKQATNWHFYYGGKFRFRKISRRSGQGATNIISRSKTPIVEAGIFIFPAPHLAFEIGLDYELATFTTHSIPDFGTAPLRGDFLLDVGVRFFLHPKGEDGEAADYGLYAGHWLVGGTVFLQNGIVLRPEVYRVFRFGWAGGIRSLWQYDSDASAAIGLEPVIRKYFFYKNKKKLFVEGSIGQYHFWAKQSFGSDDAKWEKIQRNTVFQVAGGLANSITPNFTMDVFLFYRNVEARQFDFSVFAFREIGFGVSFQGVMGRPNR